MSSEKSFAEATAVKATSSHTYSAEFPDDWCIGSVPHGGFITATFLQVAKAHFKSTLSAQKQPHTIAMHLDFLRRTQVGPALFTVKDTKLGRQASVITIRLTQGYSLSREEVIGTITQGNIPLESGVSFTTSWSLTPPPLPCNLSLLKQDKDANWTRQKDMPFSQFRRATQKTQFYFPRKGQRVRSSADEWIRLASGERWTNESLGFVADTWPMPVEAFSHSENPYDVHTKKDSSDVASAKGDSKGDAKGEQIPPAKFWYPTLLLNLDVKKALPEEGVEWLFVRVDTKVIKNGRMDIEVVICDEGGEVVALSQHVAFAVPAERNLAERKTGASKI